MISEFIISWLAKKVFDTAFDRCRQSFDSMGAKLIATPFSFQKAMEAHLLYVDLWSSEVALADPQSTKTLTKIYIHLDCYLQLRRERFNESAVSRQILLVDVFRLDCRNFVILGQPGAGKTTSMKYLCQNILHQEGFLEDRFKCPLVVRLRDLYSDLNANKRFAVATTVATKPRLVGHLFDLLGLALSLPEKGMDEDRKSEVSYNLKLSAIVKFLDESSALLILDGFDEIPHDTARNITLQEVRLISQSLAASSIVITCRTGDFSYLIDRFRAFEISLLNDIQIRDFASKWLNEELIAKEFLNQLKASPYFGATMKPLTLAHLCAIFEREGKIPEKPKSVYRKILNLALTEWSQTNSVLRPTQYAGFEPDRKYEFLCRVAYELTCLGSLTVFKADLLADIYEKCCQDFELPARDAKGVAVELESHTGLFLQCGYESYEFLHKSLQEFLVAEYLVKLPAIPKEHGLLMRLPNELAIAITISSNPSLYFCELVFNRFVDFTMSPEFLGTFITRLIQERPEFNHYPEVILALVVLYSNYLYCGPLSAAQLQLFYFDDIVSDFEKLVELLIRRNTKDVISSRYLIEKEHRSYDGGIILQMAKSHKAPLLELGYSLPSFVYCRKSFYDKLLSA